MLNFKLMKKIFLTSLSLLFAVTGSHAQWVTNGSNQVYSAGKVGIGTSNPVATFTLTPMLSVGTGANIATNFLAGTNYVLGNTAGSYLYPFEFQHSNNGNVDRLLFTPYRRVAGLNWQGTAYRMQIAVDNSFTSGDKAYVEIGVSDPNASGGGFISLGTEGQDRLVITSAGNVGIGTTLATEKLAVNGKIHAKEVKVDNDNWPDYVFDESYQTKSLKDLEAYIKKNKHLPEIPTAADVKSNGVDLGQMNAKLLKKIEELTLLLIEQNKRIEKLESDNKSKN